MKTSVPWWRWLITLVFGYLLWDIGRALSIMASLAVAGDEFAILGNFWPLVARSLVQVVIILIGMKFIWRIVSGDLATIGLVSNYWKQDVLYGGIVGISLALVQYFIILPLTGGAQRSDVIASLEIVGTNPSGLVGAIIFGWLAGAITEEIFYRGHLIGSLQELLGGAKWALWVASIFSIGFFALDHGYQGSSGILNAGIIAVVYTSLFLRRKSLMPGIVAHGIYDTLAFLGLYFLL